MKIEAVLNRYLTALEKGSYEDVMVLFAEGATVHSPLYGKVAASLFYRDLFEDTQKSTITPLEYFISATDEHTAAVHFRYKWILKDGTPTSFECVDILQLTPDGKIDHLTIIYDTATIRQKFEEMKGG
jgi:ketosteroid isomerase-like protein